MRRVENSLFAVANDKPIGMIVYIINDKNKTKHFVDIFGIFVKKEYRGQDVGTKLIETALYKKCGFQLAGRLKKELKFEDKFYDELIMEKFL